MVSFTPKGLILPDPPTIIAENLQADPLLRDSIWTQAGALGVLTDVMAGGPNGNGYLEFAMSAINTSSPMIVPLINGTGVSAQPCKPNTTYNVSCWAYRGAALGGTTTRWGVIWYNAAGATIGTTNTANFPTVQDDFGRYDVDVVSPPLAAYMKPQFIWSGTYPATATLRNGDAQVTEGPGVKPFTLRLLTADDGEYVDVDHLNFNLDRIAEIGVGALPVLSSDRPDLFTINDMPGTILYETDSETTLVRRNDNSNGSIGLGNVAANWRSIIPGAWREWNYDGIWSDWLVGNNNTKRARVLLMGRLCFVHLEAVIGAGGSVAGNIGLSFAGLPFNNDNNSEAGYPADGFGLGPWPIGDAQAVIGGNTYFGRVVQSGGSIVARTLANTAAGSGNVFGATQPAAWGVGDGVSLDFCYYTT